MCEPLGCVIVSQGDVRVVENFGKFERVAFPGLHFVFPCLCQNAKPPLSMRLQQIEVYCETKTKENVFVNIKIAVQSQIEAYEPSIRSAQYRLQNALSQIESYVFDVVRSSVPKLDLDEVFTSKGEISDGIRHSLSDAMGSFGYKIIASPVTDIDPNAEVKRAMNEINKASLARLARLARLASLASLARLASLSRCFRSCRDPIPFASARPHSPGSICTMGHTAICSPNPHMYGSHQA